MSVRAQFAKAFRRLPGAVVLGLCACASDPMPAIRADYVAGRYPQASDALEQLVNQRGRDSHLFALELGVAAQAASRPQLAVQAMRRARDELDRLAGRGIWESALAMLSDDTALDYEGYDYEHVLVRAMLAVADLMSGGRDAVAYALQVLDRQQKIIAAADEEQGGNLKRDYKLVAFGSYLRAILNEERVRDRSIAEREFRKVKELAPDFAFADVDLQRATKGAHSQPGNGIVHVIALVGRGPFRVQVMEPATQELLGLAQWIWNIYRDRPVLPNLYPVPVPALAFHDDNPTEVQVSVDGRRVGATATITDVEAMARAEFAATRREVMVRALIRRMLKTAVAEVGKEALYKGRRGDRHDPYRRRDHGRDLASLGIDLLSILWSASEQADLRCWSLLPARVQVLRLELPAGVRQLEFRAAVAGAPSGRPQTVSVRVDEGFNSYVCVVVPTIAGGPTPMTSASPASTETSATTNPTSANTGANNGKRPKP